MKLYSYWRSTTSFRVRAALNLKGVVHDIVLVDLNGGAQNDGEYRAINSSGTVPSLVLEGGVVLTQSMSIIEYLDAIYPEPRLFPLDPDSRACVTAAAQLVASDIHPVNNLRIMQQLKSQFGATADQCQSWMVHWMQDGFAALESRVRNDTEFSFGESPNIADICITAQAYNAHRWGVDLTAYPNIARIEQNCLALPEISAAHPNQQPDATK